MDTKMNIPTSFDDFDRGQVGIGTLIIFIALVLVAAVAAGVLVNTAGDLQSKAAATGEDAQAGVSNQIDVVSATGIDSDDNKEIETVELVVKKSAGSDDIDLSQATVQYNSGSALETLTYDDTSAGASAFATTDVKGTAPDATRLSDTSQRVKITIDTESIEPGNGLGEGANVDLSITDQSGATTSYAVNVHSVLEDEYVSV